jgi:hypothetical protein
MFEMWFPTGFFGIMIHLLVHLIKDFNIFGPIGAIDVIPSNRLIEMLFVKQRKTKRDHGYAIYV